MADRDRKSRRRRRKTTRDSDVRIDRVWRVVIHPVFVGFLLFVAGLLLCLAPLSKLPGTMTHGWWVTALRFGDVAQSVASILAVFAVLATGVAWHRYRLVRGLAEPLGTADVESDVKPPAVDMPRLLRFGPQLGIVLIVAGVLVGIGTWLHQQTALPVSRVAVPPGRELQSYPAIEVSGALKVMLPDKFRVTALDSAAQTATLEFISPGEEEGTTHVVRAGEPTQVKGFRYALLGVEYDERFLRAVLTSSASDTIDAAGTVGERVRFNPDGPGYEVLQVVRNYLGVMGPAVRLKSDELGEFWVFQRTSEGRLPDLGHRITLERLQTGPVAVLAVSPESFSEGIAAGGLLFVFGLALFLLTSEAHVRRRKDGDGWLAWSLNDAGPLTEATVASGNEGESDASEDDESEDDESEDDGGVS